MLSRHGRSPAQAEVLVPRLKEIVETVACSSKASQLARLWDMILTLLKYRNACQLVFIDTFSSRAFWFVVVISALCRWFSVPYIPVIRGGDFASRLKRSPWFCQTIFSKAAVSVTPSLFLSRLFADVGYGHHVIPNFLNIKDYPFKRRMQVSPRLLWVRAFHAVYNPVLAIDVLVGLLKDYPDAALCMVGADKDGSLQQVQQYVMEKDVLPHVQFTGYLTKKEWIVLSAMHDIFINTTDFDNMPVSVLEAMALGLPIVTTNVGGIPYLIKDGENGLLVGRGDAQGFIDAIRNLTRNHTLAEQLTMKARKDVEKLDWEEIRSQWTSIIKQYSRAV